MVFKYKIYSGEEIIIEGALVANDEQQATAKIYKKVPKNTNGIKVEIGNKTIFTEKKYDSLSKIFKKPVAKKVDNRPKCPWD